MRVDDVSFLRKPGRERERERELRASTHAVMPRTDLVQLEYDPSRCGVPYVCVTLLYG